MGLDMLLYKFKRPPIIGEEPLMTHERFNDLYCNSPDGYEEVGYWRKANAIHRFFVDAVQDGEDDCGWHNEVTPEVLKDLRDRCKRIIESTVVTNPNIVKGMHFDFSSESWQEVMEDSEVTANAEVCSRELPTQGGFFFGDLGYDDWYLDHIGYTYELCKRLLKETDFESEMLLYISSW